MLERFGAVIGQETYQLLFYPPKFTPEKGFARGLLVVPKKSICFSTLPARAHRHYKESTHWKTSPVLAKSASSQTHKKQQLSTAVELRKRIITHFSSQTGCLYFTFEKWCCTKFKEHCVRAAAGFDEGKWSTTRFTAACLKHLSLNSDDY